MRRTAIALSIISMLGVGSFTVISNASDQGLSPQPAINENTVATNTTYTNPTNNGNCKRGMSLTQEQKTLIEKGYNELTQVEKETLGKYRSLGKGNLSDTQLKELYTIEDKVNKYMDENFKAIVKERRENRELRKEQRNNGNCQNGQGTQNNQGKGNGQGKGSCQL
ncbi:hypothetical protein [Romboutsia sp.]|uniref:hypothetical protein n=1 Tax=Romboutsia sp. TaxID=1965302 RepID=UPI003F400542